MVALLLLGIAGQLAAQQVQRIPGPTTDTRLAVTTAAAAARPIPFSAPTQRAPGSWRSAVILGAVAGVIGGIVIGSMDGETTDRSTGDRVKAGLVGGLIIAVPVTVIFAMLTGGED